MRYCLGSQMIGEKNMKTSEYCELQELLSKKLITMPNNKECAFNDGVLACKSILHSYFKAHEMDGKDGNDG